MDFHVIKWDAQKRAIEMPRLSPGRSNKFYIYGENHEIIDGELFDEFSKRCAAITVELTLNRLKMPNGFQFQIFPQLNHLELINSSVNWIGSRWSNLTSLTLANIIGNEYIQSYFGNQLKNVSIEFALNAKDIINLLGSIDKENPALERMALTFTSNENFKSLRNDSFVKRDPCYFENLKKLSITAFPGCHNPFEYLGISTKNLTDLTINGMTVDNAITESISVFTKLSELTINCAKLLIPELRALCELPNLVTVRFLVEEFQCESNDLVELFKIVKCLINIEIISNGENSNFHFDEEVYDEFCRLAYQRENISIKISFPRRKIAISARSLSDVRYNQKYVVHSKVKRERPF